MTDRRSEEYVSMNSHDRIGDTILKVVISCNRWLVNSVLNINPHDEEHVRFISGGTRRPVEGALSADLSARLRTPDPLNPNQVERRLGAEYCEILNTVAAWPGMALPWNLGGTLWTHGTACPGLLQNYGIFIMWSNVGHCSGILQWL